MFSLDHLPIEVIAAIITSYVGLCVYLLVAESKITEFRQRWRDDLKRDVSVAISNANTLYNFNCNKSSPFYSFKEFRVEAIRCHNDFMSSVVRIRLSLRSSERSEKIFTKDILSSLEILESYFNGENPINDLKTLKDCESQICNLAEKILKKEWRQVKTGEPITKLVANSFFTIMFFLISVAVIYYHFEMHADVAMVVIAFIVFPFGLIYQFFWAEKFSYFLEKLLY